LLRTGADRLNDTRVSYSWFWFSRLFAAFSYLKVPVVAKVEVVVELATLRQRVYLLKCGLRVRVGTIFPVEVFFENNLTVSVIATRKELEEVITVEINGILYRIVKFEQ
jgi:hypothetical protein